jgi:3-methylcrotonyl-CoA carboxylase alpha subunit
MDPAVIRTIFIPNRGEIAVRITRTAREMGLITVLGHSEDDATSLAARVADRTVSLGDGEVRETYLNVGRVIDAAREAGADAIHPGYGFLSERAELSAAAKDAGITFIGPSADSISRMGSKAESRGLMEKLGVPVVPGYHGADQSDDTLRAGALKIGFPLLVKASAGGGGKGMKIVSEVSQLADALASARREALKAFGDDRLLLERYIERPRHIEFQIFGDQQGNVIHLFERDCSIQRRHQKVIEESPAPGYPDALRQKMAASAIAAARGVNYVNAGTVEFIVGPDGQYYFLEMNTRLQVEHPVTEAVLGLDLVRAQIDVASGRPLPAAAFAQRGHAIECRLYAEDPDHGFLPQSGPIEVYREPSGPGIRVDSGVEEGSVVGIRYDPMLAKVIAYGESRDAAIARLERAIAEYVVLGVTTNAGFLRRVLMQPAFREGEVDTGFLERHAAALRSSAADGDAVAIGAVLTAQKRAGGASATAKSQQRSVWDEVGPWGV